MDVLKWLGWDSLIKCDNSVNSVSVQALFDVANPYMVQYVYFVNIDGSAPVHHLVESS